jgi:hypothetical protein
MSGSSTPTRPLELDEQDYLSEGYRWKRLQHDASPSDPASRSSSRNSCGQSSSLRSLSDGVQHVVVDSEYGAGNAPLRQSKHWRYCFPVNNYCLTYEDLPPLAELQLRDSFKDLSPQVLPSFLMDGLGFQKPDARKKEQICFGIVRTLLEFPSSLRDYFLRQLDNINLVKTCRN